MDSDLDASFMELLQVSGRSHNTSRSAGQKMKKKLQSKVPPELKPVHCVTCLEQHAGLDSLNDHLSTECMQACSNTIKTKAKSATLALKKFEADHGEEEDMSDADLLILNRLRHNKVLAVWRVNALERRHAGRRDSQSSNSSPASVSRVASVVSISSSSSSSPRSIGSPASSVRSASTDSFVHVDSDTESQ